MGLDSAGRGQSGNRMTKIHYLVGAAVGVMAFAAAPAQAGDVGFYVSVFAGASFADDIDTDQESIPYSLDTKVGYLLGGIIGMDVTDAVRAEVELSHASWEADSASLVTTTPTYIETSATGDVTATFLLANAWLDIENNSSFTPYLGGGLGVGWADADTDIGTAPNGYGPGEMGFAFQFGGGVKVELSEQIALDFGYRFKSIQDIDFEDDGGGNVYRNGNVYTHNAQLGLTYSF